MTRLFYLSKKSVIYIVWSYMSTDWQYFMENWWLFKILIGRLLYLYLISY